MEITLFNICEEEFYSWFYETVSLKVTDLFLGTKSYSLFILLDLCLVWPSHSSSHFPLTSVTWHWIRFYPTFQTTPVSSFLFLSLYSKYGCSLSFCSHSLPLYLLIPSFSFLNAQSSHAFSYYCMHTVYFQVQPQSLFWVQTCIWSPVDSSTWVIHHSIRFNIAKNKKKIFFCCPQSLLLHVTAR